MPLYEYQCDHCGCTFDRLLKVQQMDEPQSCECGSSETRRLISAPNFHLTPGNPGYEMRELENRYAKRNARLDAMPKDQQDRMSAFMKKYNVHAQAPSSWPKPEKTKAEKHADSAKKEKENG